MRQYRTDDFFAHGGFDKVPKSARLGNAIARSAPPPAMSTDHILLGGKGSSGDSTPKIISGD
jgi:hypothetical protein